jgi:hypothetical protein
MGEIKIALEVKLANVAFPHIDVVGQPGEKVRQPPPSPSRIYLADAGKARRPQNI